MLSKSLIQFSVDGQACVPSLLLGLRPNYREGRQPHPSTEKWIKDLLSMAPPIRQPAPPIRKLPKASYPYPSEGRQNENHNCRNLTKLISGGLDGRASAYNARDLGSVPGSGRSSGEGNGTPLQYSCLENPMDGGAWYAIVQVKSLSCV